MKKLLSAMLVIISLDCFAQNNNWFVSFSSGPSFGGPCASIKSQMKAQGYDDDAESTFVIWGSGHTSYPRGSAVALLARGGKKITERKSIYFVAGLSQMATVEGFKSQGWSDGFFGLFAGTYGVKVSMDYSIYQLTAGYMYSSRSRTKIGFGPSLYALNYKLSTNYSSKESNTALIPGASFTTRIPLGKEKKLVGLEFVIEGNMAPPIKMKTNNTDGFQPKNANMFSINTGFALTFHK